MCKEIMSAKQLHNLTQRHGINDLHD